MRAPSVPGFASIYRPCRCCKHYSLWAFPTSHVSAAEYCNIILPSQAYNSNVYATPTEYVNNSEVMQGIVLAAPVSGREKICARQRRIFNVLILLFTQQYTWHFSIPIPESSLSSVSLPPKHFFSLLGDLKNSYGNRGHCEWISALVGAKPPLGIMLFLSDVRIFLSLSWDFWQSPVAKKDIRNHKNTEHAHTNARLFQLIWIKHRSQRKVTWLWRVGLSLYIVWSRDRFESRDPA